MSHLTSLPANEFERTVKLRNVLASEPTYVLSEIIGVGGDRECWRHPADPTLCIKVAKLCSDRSQNEIDFHYWKHLSRRGVSGPHITRVHGWATTNRGRGLVVDLVQQPDGKSCSSFPDALRSGTLSEAEATLLVHEAFDWLVTCNIILADYGIDNFLIRKSPQGAAQLVIVDGLGARHFDLKYWARRTFRFLARRKTRQFQRKTLRLLADRSSKLWVAKKARDFAN